MIFVIFWFTSAIACAASVTGIKKTTDVSKIIPRIPGCIGKNGSCSPTIEGNYATLDVSAVSIPVTFANPSHLCRRHLDLK